MLRVLHIARATTPGANAKAAAVAREPDLALWLVRPLDEASAAVRGVPCEGLRLVRCWRRRDPHRGIYATLDFGLRAAAPHIIHAEEEPDSLAALQVAAARRVAAPSARLVLHTWQNVNRRKGPPVRAVLETTLRAANAVLCATDAAVLVLRRLGFEGAAPVIVPAGYDPRVFCPARRPGECREISGAGSRHFTIGYVGRLAPEKGLETLVSASAGLGPPRSLEIVGTGPVEGALASQARDDGLPIRFHGRLDAQGVADFLRRIDVLVLPSRTTPVWAEQFGRVLVEAMACGTPVVGSTSGAIPSVIADAGLVFPEGDAPALAARLDDLRRSPELRARLATRGLERAGARFSAECVGQRTAAFYRELAAAPPGAAR